VRGPITRWTSPNQADNPFRESRLDEIVQETSRHGVEQEQGNDVHDAWDRRAGDGPVRVDVHVDTFHMR
jgi:hypothetical protein